MHKSVLYHNVLTWIAPRDGGQYIDATLGYGGHTLGLLEGSAPTGQLLAFDKDKSAIAWARERIDSILKTDTDKTRLTTVHSSFSAIKTVAPQLGFASGTIDGIIFDLGLSSMQLDNRERGFSFRYDAPLDMRMDQTQGKTAAHLINTLSESELREIFWRYGDEQHGRKLAQVIVDNRPIHTTVELADLVATHKPSGRYKKGRKQTAQIHPATKLFQALRIAVNDELGALETALPDAIDLLKPGGRIAVISFHSLEDRYVKNLFRDLAKDCICPTEQPICTCDWEAVLSLPQRKAIKPSATEIAENKRSRSARLRIAEKR